MMTSPTEEMPTTVERTRSSGSTTTSAPRLGTAPLSRLLAAGSAETFVKRFERLGGFLCEHERREDEILQLTDTH